MRGFLTKQHNRTSRGCSELQRSGHPLVRFGLSDGSHFSY
ncbi:hypothetical protein HMPREF3196_01576 [Bifidobacterium bifidum]|uniref:Uncharacterized protein n=1 Tax=Bifidobacterium bifidum TaxID=1681 RepID=A0A133KLL1_BIFBI|nr:hypothetical protein HMPREF3196_01576 [Bifidobacterium bifidum]